MSLKNEEIKEIIKKDDDSNSDKLKKIKCPTCTGIIEFRHKNKPECCPYCREKYFDKPITEYELFKLQEKFLITRNNDLLGQMYLILKLYAKKIITKLVKNRFFYNKVELETRAHDAANQVILYYLEKPEFKIEASFGGYLSLKVLNVLYYGKENDMNDSLNAMIDDEKELDEYLPFLSEEARTKMVVNFEQNIIDESSNVIDRLSNEIKQMSYKTRANYSIQHSLLFLTGLKNKIKTKSDSFMDSYYIFCGLEVQRLIDSALFLIYKKIKLFE